MAFHESKYPEVPPISGAGVTATHDASIAIYSSVPTKESVRKSAIHDSQCGQTCGRLPPLHVQESSSGAPQVQFRAQIRNQKA